MTDRPDPTEDRHEPAHLRSPIDPVIVGAQAAHLSARDHAVLLPGEPHNPLLNSTWAPFSAHTAD
jgi:hypothetical protein